MKLLEITEGLALKPCLTPRAPPKRSEAEGQEGLSGTGAAGPHCCGYLHQPGQWQSRGKMRLVSPQLGKGSAEFCTQAINRMVVRLRAQAEFSWKHQILPQRNRRPVSQNTRRAFLNAILDAYVEVTALL